MGIPQTVKSLYEFHIHSDPGFPLIFHHNHITDEYPIPLPHWHESIELLCFLEGDTAVIRDTQTIRAASGDIVVIGSGMLHAFQGLSAQSHYLCLIIDKELCASFGFSLEQPLPPVVTDRRLFESFLSIDTEMTARAPQYKAMIKAMAMALLASLYRHHGLSEDAPDPPPASLTVVRRAITYIGGHFTQTVTTEDIASHVGLSKYYFCRMFKAVTGLTVTDYVNKMRCEYARRLIALGESNIGESARLSGFQNLSYFTKTYKKHIGARPSESIK